MLDGLLVMNIAFC